MFKATLLCVSLLVSTTAFAGQFIYEKDLDTYSAAGRTCADFQAILSSEGYAKIQKTGTFGGPITNTYAGPGFSCTKLIGQKHMDPMANGGGLKINGKYCKSITRCKVDSLN